MLCLSLSFASARYENLFTVLAGTKRVKLFHQSQRPKLYMKSRAHMYGGGSQSISPVDIDKVDLHRFPLAGTISMRHRALCFHSFIGAGERSSAESWLNGDLVGCSQRVPRFNHDSVGLTSFLCSRLFGGRRPARWIEGRL